jgi:hypothetical protein
MNFPNKVIPLSLSYLFFSIRSDLWTCQEPSRPIDRSIYGCFGHESPQRPTTIHLYAPPLPQSPKAKQEIPPNCSERILIHSKNGEETRSDSAEVGGKPADVTVRELAQGLSGSQA